MPVVSRDRHFCYRHTVKRITRWHAHWHRGLQLVFPVPKSACSLPLGEIAHLPAETARSDRSANLLHWPVG
eukprot:5603962-Pleurochrysis_carterae.AAC.1